MEYKVVINRCFGGFGISPRAVKWLMENAENPDLRNYIKSKMIKYKPQMKEACDAHDERMINDVWRNVCYDVEYEYKIARHDADLVRCVETLGDAASDIYSKLVVETIHLPIYRIHENDGIEFLICPENEEYITIG